MSYDLRDGDESNLPGVIDLLGEGFAIAASRPLLVLPLILLQLVLVLAPRLTVGGIAGDVASEIRDRGSNWSIVADEVESLEGFNILELIASGSPSLQIDALSSLLDEGRDIPGWHERSIVASDLLVLPFIVLALATGVIFVAFFRLILAAGIGSGNVVSNVRPRSLLAVAWRFVAAAITAAALILLVSLPVILASIVLAAFGLQGVALLWLLLLVPVVWGAVHFYFVVHALVVDRLRVLPAFRASYRVVRRDRWQAARFICVSLLISTGLTFMLESIARRPEWAVLAVILNAFVATGTILAAMMFYRDRARSLGLISLQEGA
ncbi:MAG: hypothetical protein M9890_01310 [Thermomicrobiales bacterium]|nr:hypothetical protein [Thermomicrobiales bacterium]